MLTLKAWRVQQPQDKDPPVPLVLRVESYRLQATPGKAGGLLHVSPPRQPLPLGTGSGSFSRIEIYTQAEVLRESVRVEDGQLSRYAAPLYKVWVEHLGRLGTREGMRLRLNLPPSIPRRLPARELPGCKSQIRCCVSPPTPSGWCGLPHPMAQKSTMEYGNSSVTIR